MYVKLTPDKFSAILDRFWTRFCRDWDVLLHGNPAVDIFGGLKLAAGGELGYGVGEEDWGSGDREVLEDLVHRTEGLVDLLVHRFGEPAPPEDDYITNDPSQDTRQGLPWLGCGSEPQASDGLIFSGVGAITRPSVRDISTWVRDIYAYGEHAYGVKDNPHRQRRKKRRRQPVEEPEIPPATEEALKNKAIDRLKGIELPPDPRPQMHDRVASHDHATGTPGTQVASHPGIPPPIVSAVEASLNRASASADSHASNQPPQPPEQSSNWNLGSSDKWVKYLTFGLASGAKRSESPKRPEQPRRTSTSSSKTVKGVSFPKSSKDDNKDEPPMQHLDPNPDGYQAMAALQRQRRQENSGHFLVGYRGDLDLEPAEEKDHDSDSTIGGSEIPEAERNLLRTVKVELTEKGDTANDDLDSRDSFIHNDTSSRLRVLVYIHRPFIHVFLFEQRTPSLSITAFYRELHKHIRPLYKSLLNSTSAQKVAERITAATSSPPQPSSVNSQAAPFAPPRNSPVWDLVYDPVNLSCHTSLPNIPEHGQSTPYTGISSSGKDAQPQWTRLEALNVHSHILFTLQHSSRNTQETERTSKTTRHWWVVWLRIPQPGDDEAKYPRPIEFARTAFLVRKARDHVVERKGMGMGMGKGMASRVSSGMYNLVGVRGGSSSENEDAQGAGWGSAGAMAGGIGVDARKYVENLLSLNR